jgi:hypothetical protein
MRLSSRLAVGAITAVLITAPLLTGAGGASAAPVAHQQTTRVAHWAVHGLPDHARADASCTACYWENLQPYYIYGDTHGDALQTANSGTPYVFYYVDGSWGIMADDSGQFCWNYVPSAGVVEMDSCQSADTNEWFEAVPCPHSSWCFKNYTVGTTPWVPS